MFNGQVIIFLSSVLYMSYYVLFSKGRSDRLLNTLEVYRFAQSEARGSIQVAIFEVKPQCLQWNNSQSTTNIKF